ncbi:hypothetical protein [Helicobacter sp. 16-1353]|nr:hypothetical protein [Helicobacter sp. 16-1353]
MLQSSNRAVFIIYIADLAEFLNAVILWILAKVWISYFARIVELI